MPDDGLAELRFPVGGVDRSQAYAKQPGVTAFDMLNVRPQSTLADRERGGRRPAIAEQYTLGGVSTPVRMLNQVRYVSGTSQAALFHNFQNLGGWTATDFSGGPPGLPYTRPFAGPNGTDGGTYDNGDSFQLWPDDVYPNRPLAYVGNNFRFTADDDEGVPIVYHSAMVHNAVDPFDAAQDYTFSLLVVPQIPTAPNEEEGWPGFPPRWEAWYTLFFAMDDTNPQITQDGIAIEWGFKYNHPATNNPRNEYRWRARQWRNGGLVSNWPDSGSNTFELIGGPGDPSDGVLGVETARLIVNIAPAGNAVSFKHTLRTMGADTVRGYYPSIGLSAPLNSQRRFAVALDYDGAHSGPPIFSQDDRGVYLSEFSLNYQTHDAGSEDEGTNLNKLVAGANGRIWREDFDFGIMLTVGQDNDLSDGTQDNNKQIMSVEYGGKLFIADSELVGSYTDGVINNVVSPNPGSDALSELSTTTIRNWITEGVIEESDGGAVPHHIVTITNRGTGNTLHREDVAVYSIKSIKDDPAGNENAIIELGTFPHPDSGSAEAARVVRNTGAHSGISFRVERCGKVYDPSTDTVSKWIQYDWDIDLDGDGTTFDYGWLSATAYPIGDDDGPKGSIFAGAPIAASFLDRIWLAGLPENPNAIVACRKGDPYDWDFRSDTSDLAAAIGIGAGLAGRITQAITALAPVTDDYMLIGTHGQCYRMLGDPAFGGSIDAVSLTVGIIDRFAWARGPNGETVFLSADGLYILDPGAQNYPVRWSKQRMPRELINVNPREITVCMAYDQQQEGFNLWLTKRNDKERLSWFIDYDTKGFFPEKRTYPSLNPWVALEWLKDSGEVVTITGGSGGLSTGEIHYYDENLYHDLGLEPDEDLLQYPIENYVYLGPFMLGDGYSEGMISELVGKFPESLPISIPTDPLETRTITYSVAAGDTAEQAVANAVEGRFRETGLFGPRLNPKARVRVRGGWAVVKLGSDGSPWAMETLLAVVRRMGIQKVLR